MNLWNSLAGVYTVEISSASFLDMLTAVNGAKIRLYDVIYVDDLTVRGKVFAYAFGQLKRLLHSRGEVIKIIAKEGAIWSLISLRKRPVLFAGLTVFIFMALYLPSRVLFVCVEGNTSVPTKLIIERAESCGIKFGTSRVQVRSEKVKNALLAAMPELQWAGVNTYGCVAVISVKERAVSSRSPQKTGVASIVSNSDGVITEMTVIRGTSLCREGQAVKKGQVLISGYTDRGISTKAEVADGEIYAQTIRRLSLVTPVTYDKIEALTETRRNYYLKIGKKLINFENHSGIYDASYVKIQKESYLLLPGGFRLPISLVTEELTRRTTNIETSSPEDAYSWLEGYSKTYLGNHLLAGEILQSNFIKTHNCDKFTLLANFACREMIGRVRYEEIIDGNGKRN